MTFEVCQTRQALRLCTIYQYPLFKILQACPDAVDGKSGTTFCNALYLA